MAFETDVKRKGPLTEIISRLIDVETKVRRILAGTSGGSGSSSSGREVLTANRTYYVRTDGSDSNNGLANTAAGAFLTVQKAVDTAASLDCSIYSVTIQIADGTYAGAVTLKTILGSGTYTIQGNSGTPSNVLISVTSADAFVASVPMQWTLKDMKISTTTSGSSINAVNGAFIKASNIVFGACATYHINCTSYSKVNMNGNYEIAGNAAIHWYADNLGIITAAGITVTLTGTPAFSTSFAWADNLSLVRVNADTFSGSATGKRYTSNNNSNIYTNGGGATFIPGNSAGSTSSGGLYT